jgi:hypothetical protein
LLIHITERHAHWNDLTFQVARFGARISSLTEPIRGSAHLCLRAECRGDDATAQQIELG